jgi:hypothetical protein
MTFDELKAAVATAESANEHTFDVLADVGGLVARAQGEESVEMAQAREICIRMVEHRDALGGQAALLDAMLRRLGLFPYIDIEGAGVRDLLAIEAHRPLDLPDEDLIFHRVQAEVYRRLLDGENVVLSAPTSFGKSLVIDALIASGNYRNIVVVVPTIALIDETRRRLSRFSPEYKLITHVSQPLADRNLLLLTQERVLDLAELPDVDLFVIDEFYKLSPDRDGGLDRTYLLNQAFQRLYRTGAQFYFLGPNIQALKAGIPDDFLGRLIFIRTGVSTVALDEIHVDVGEDAHAALAELCSGLDEPTLIYCQSPRSVRQVLAALIDGDVSAPHASLDRAVEWTSRAYHPDWSVCRGLAHGIGVHHGQLPRALAAFMVRAFKERRLRFLICTSSLIEGVNTPAKNVVVFDKKIGTTDFDFFDYGNIRGRSGRMSVHHVGRVYLFHATPSEELPEVDIPALSQPDDVPSSLLLGLEPDEMSDRSRDRLQALLADARLSAEVLRASVGLDVERQLETATVIEQDLNTYAPLLRWTGIPNRAQLEAAAGLIWTHLNAGRREHGAFSASQLATRISMLRDSTDVGEMVGYQASTAFRITRGDKIDEIVEDVLDFLRFWASHTFPRLLIALDRIAGAVLARHGVATGDFTVFAAQVENLFLPVPIVALEEYGLPRIVAMKLRDQLQPDGDLDATLARLAAIDPETVSLEPFELELLEDVRLSLPAQP